MQEAGFVGAAPPSISALRVLEGLLRRTWTVSPTAESAAGEFEAPMEEALFFRLVLGFGAKAGVMPGSCGDCSAIPESVGKAPATTSLTVSTAVVRSTDLVASTPLPPPPKLGRWVSRLNAAVATRSRRRLPATCGWRQGAARTLPVIFGPTFAPDAFNPGGLSVASCGGVPAIVGGDRGETQYMARPVGAAGVQMRTQRHVDRRTINDTALLVFSKAWLELVQRYAVRALSKSVAIE